MDDVQIQSHDNYFVIAGGPGAGKTTLIDALSKRGEACVPESGRAIILDQVRIGGRALPWLDAALYAELMLARHLANYRAFSDLSARVFFDHALASLAGYLRLVGLPILSHVGRAATILRYNPLVFMAPPWKAIYVNDAERKQTFAEAVATFQAVRDAYVEQGYQPLELPLASVEARVSFVLDNVGT